MNDLELLRKYEPVARFTKGESFYPTAVDEYVKECSLWITDPHKGDRLLVPYRQLDIDCLVEFEESPADQTMYLRFVDEPLAGLEYQRWLLDPKRERFIAPGRLARVPLIFRLVDSFFDLSLLVRGQVPGGLSAAAEIKNRNVASRDPRRVYYGRVVRSAGWVSLQYVFFYSMNNWRSGFLGVNDHEADWEQIFVFLADSEDGEPEPCWVAYASHDFRGDDLRRRWDDPQLVRVGDHPVIFVGAGSHASYFEQGEYLMGAEPEFLQPLKGALVWLRKFWNETLCMGKRTDTQQSSRAILSVPFIDYARGDGLRVGPGQDEDWDPEIISDEVAWVHAYRGLWGLDTHDPIGGERAPAGPKYNRDGTVRQSWYDPIGWAGLDKVFPPAELRGEIDARLESLQDEFLALDGEIDAARESLREQALGLTALQMTEYSGALLRKSEDELRSAQAQLQTLQAQRSELVETRHALEKYSRRVERGDLGPPTAHLKRVHHPEPPVPPQHRIVEIWAAFSGALILVGIVAVVLLQPERWPISLIGLGFVLGAVEALTRGDLVDYLLIIVIGMAVIAAIILVVEFWTWLLVLGIVGAAIFMIRGNIQELRR